jgi:hypothetical protein
MKESKPTERQRKKWREDRARLRLMAKHFPAPPRVVLTPEERRERKNAAAREARAAKALGAIDLTCPDFLADGRNLPRKRAPKPSKPALNRAEGPWDVNLPRNTVSAREASTRPPRPPKRRQP